MKHAAYSMLAALALSLMAAGCNKSTPPESELPPAAPAEADLKGAPAGAEGAFEAFEMPAPAVELPELSADEAAAVVASVNDHDITAGDIHKILNLFMKQAGSQIRPDQLESALPQLRERIVEELIMRRILLDEVAKQGISLSDTEFNEIKAELTEGLPSGKTLEDVLAETGMSEAEVREQMSIRKMVLAKAESLAQPTETAIQEFYDENKDGFSQEESVSAAHILIKVDPADDEAAKTAKRERLEGLRQQVLAGGDFTELAKANSDCPSASTGGDLGAFSRGQMVAPFEDAAFTQPVGSVGEIVETQFGYHLIKVSEHKEARTLDFAEVKERIREMLVAQNQQDAVKQFMDDLRQNARIERFDQPPPEEEAAPELEGAAEAAPEPAAAVTDEPVIEASAAAEPAAEEAPAVQPAEEILEAVGETVDAEASALEEAAEGTTETVESAVEDSAGAAQYSVEEEVEQPVPSETGAE